MNDLMIIYRAPDSQWLEAMQWATDQGLRYVMDSESCYRGPRYDVTHVFATGETILADYGRLPSKPEIVDLTPETEDDELDDSTE